MFYLKVASNNDNVITKSKYHRAIRKARELQSEFLLTLFLVSVADMAWLIIFGVDTGAIKSDHLFKQKIEFVKTQTVSATKENFGNYPIKIRINGDKTYIFNEKVYTLNGLKTTLFNLRKEQVLKKNHVFVPEFSEDIKMGEYFNLVETLENMGFEVKGSDLKRN